MSQTNLNSGVFGFSLKIHINPDNRGSELHGADSMDIPLSGVREHRQQRPSSPMARFNLVLPPSDLADHIFVSLEILLPDF